MSLHDTELGIYPSGKLHRPSCVSARKEIEHNRTQWKVGNTSHHERDSLGDKCVQEEIDQ